MPDNYEINQTNGWVGGINSLVNPAFLPDNQVQWSVNTLNRGGIYQTRPGYSMLYDAAHTGPARGMTIFERKDGSCVMVKAVGTQIRISNAPFKTWGTLNGITLDSSDDPVHFETCVKGAQTETDGSLTIIEPYPVLIIQTGNSSAYIWDGSAVSKSNPDPTSLLAQGIPVGTWMKWAGDRLWVASENKIWASNILEPDKFTNDGSQIAGAGFLSMPGLVTGIGLTSDQNSLLVFTNETTTSIDVSILDRGTWGTTKGFKKIILPNIGCVAGRTIVNQYGMIWFLAQGGLVGLDDALTAYRSSKIHFSDQNMNRSKVNMSDDVSRACAGAFGNFLMLSVPSGGSVNRHTWVMDEGVVSDVSSDAAPAWASCWIGTAPVQWVTKVVDGHNRCFFLSRDRYPVDQGSDYYAFAWEAFTGLRRDISYTEAGALRQITIACSLETKVMTQKGFSIFGFFEAKFREMSGQVQVYGYYASRHSGYKMILQKTIQANTDTLFPTADLVGIGSGIRQSRRVRSKNDEPRLSDNDPAIEDVNTRNKDRGFSILLNWFGDAAVEEIVLYTLPRGEVIDGRVEEDETGTQYVYPDGSGLKSATNATAHTIARVPRSASPLGITPRATELSYLSLST